MQEAEHKEPKIILKYNMKELFLKQYRNCKLNRADIIVRYLAIEQFYGKNNYGFALYSKMQNLRKNSGYNVTDHDLEKFLKLIKNMEFNGFYDIDCITFMNNFELFDGSHRMALAIYFGIEYIPVQITESFRDIQYGYDFLATGFSSDEIKLVQSKEAEIIDNLFIHNNPKFNDYYNKICDLYQSQKQKFGRGMFYQSFERLQIEGQRSTKFRFHKYGLDKLLSKEHEVLDIGCNCGFLTLYTSEYVKKIIGIEYNQSLIDIANLTKAYLGITNCDFYCADFNQFTIGKKFDIIFSFAVHHWINMSMKEYSIKLAGLLNKNGFVIFESQNVETIDQDFEEKINEFCDNRFKVLYGGGIFDDRIILRKFVVLMLL